MEYQVRLAREADAELLMQARVSQLLDEGSVMKYDTRNEMIDFFQRKLRDGSLIQYIAEREGVLISTAAMMIQEYPPSISWRGERRGYITNVYTDPRYRGQGIASSMLCRLLQDARTLELGNVWLLASKQGKGVYKKLGIDEERPGLDVYMEWFEEA